MHIYLAKNAIKATHKEDIEMSKITRCNLAVEIF